MTFDRSREALGHIVENIGLAQAFTAGLAFEDFQADTKTFYAVMRCLEIISEASHRLTPEIRERDAHLPWRQVAAAGNVYRHG